MGRICVVLMSSRKLPRTLLASSLLPAGCAPILDFQGVYVPPWALCLVIGFILAYALTQVLGRREATLELAESGVFFCAVMVSATLLLWWIIFSGF
jgi:hypothetical protein